MSTLSYNQEQFLHTKGRNKDIKLITDSECEKGANAAESVDLITDSHVYVHMI